ARRRIGAVYRGVHCRPATRRYPYLSPRVDPIARPTGGVADGFVRAIEIVERIEAVKRSSRVDAWAFEQQIRREITVGKTMCGRQHRVAAILVNRLILH